MWYTNLATVGFQAYVKIILDCILSLVTMLHVLSVICNQLIVVFSVPVHCTVTAFWQSHFCVRMLFSVKQVTEQCDM